MPFNNPYLCRALVVGKARRALTDHEVTLFQRVIRDAMDLEREAIAAARTEEERRPATLRVASMARLIHFFSTGEEPREPAIVREWRAARLAEMDGKRPHYPAKERREDRARPAAEIPHNALPATAAKEPRP